MQCVILAAGRGNRLRPLTDDIPKPLLPVCGTPILDHIVAALPPVVTELVIVVGYRAEQIKAHCGDEFHGRPVQYAEQTDYVGGTGDALLAAKDLIHGTFLFMYADDIHGAAALAAVIEEEHAMLGMRSATPELFGVLVQNADGTLREILEKPDVAPSNLVNIGGFVTDASLLSYEAPVSQSGERLVTDMLTAYAQDHPVKIIEQTEWYPIGLPEHIAAAEAILCPER